MGRDPAKQATPDLFSTDAVRDSSPSPTKPADDATSQRHVLPKNLGHTVKHLSDEELDQLLKATLDEAKRRGGSPPSVGADYMPSPRRPSDLATKRMPRTDNRKNVDFSEFTLTRGQVNAVRSAFEAGITSSRIARQSHYLKRVCGRRWRRMNGTGEMTIKAHLAGLERQHKALGHELAEALAQQFDR
jgi:hypothetical protein